MPYFLKIKSRQTILENRFFSRVIFISLLAPISQLYPLSIMPENAKNKKSTTMRVIHSPNFEEKREKKREDFDSKILKISS